MIQIETLLKKAIADGASDIHLSVASPPIFRIHGQLERYGNEPLSPKQTKTIARQLLGKRWELFIEEKECDFAYEIADVSRFRINIFYQKGTISMAARIIPREIPTIEQLELPAILQALMTRPHGLILVTGPTGSGKSTTLAAMIDYVNKHANKHIITLEDPIEYVHKHEQSIVQQREIDEDTNGFPLGLRAALRQDPDVILV